MDDHKLPRGETRTIGVGQEASQSFPDNEIVSSKYTIWTFIPKNLFEQFRRIANFYFLCMGLVALLIKSPVSPVTSILPLIIVILVTAAKQGYEDLLRHRADEVVNNCLVTVVRKGCVQKIAAKKIRVGDIVKIEEETDVPCDIVLLVSSHKDSKCFVTTANLDGETNLKVIYCPKSLKRTLTVEELRFLESTIECERPSADLYKFHGRIEYAQKTSTMLRRSILTRQQSFHSNDPCLDLVKNDRIPEKNVEPETNAESIVGLTKPLLPRAAETVLKSASRRHKKNQSNGFRASFSVDPNKYMTREKRESWTFERKTSLISQRKSSLLNSRKPSLCRAEGGLADPLSSENLLLRGSKLKCTEFVFGCVVYTGQDTKLALNSKLTSSKFSTIEKGINKFLLFYLGIMVLEVIASIVLKVCKEKKTGYGEEMSCILQDDNCYRVSFWPIIIEDIFSFVVLYNYIIPISLYVTMEMQKFLGTLFFEWDMKMFDETTFQTAICNTSDLNEDLGQIEFLFTDKTGTLTENNMRFRECSINGVIYIEKEGLLYRQGRNDDHSTEEEIAMDLMHCHEEMELFLLALALCHTVQAHGGVDEPLYYSASSPDEKALVEAMSRLDIVFSDDEDDLIVLEIFGQSKIFRKLEVLEFTSDRKRMSVIIEDEEGNLTLYCKGAESAVISQLSWGSAEKILEHISHFATKGLRTLMVAYKTLTRAEYNVISVDIQKARQTLSSNRDSVVAEAYRIAESNLTVLGATGVEDQLQDDVGETLQSLRSAGIKVWILTGDKVETAVNISLSCGHLDPDSIHLYLTGHNSHSHTCIEKLQQYWRKISKDRRRNYALIVDGESLTEALMDGQELLREVCMNCVAVICCRMSPLQKSEVVHLIKNHKSEPVTAAVGDGANDVSMIQEAHVGLGIMGKEGRQAMRCSDFAVAKFKFLREALLVHGHWYYLRVATLVQYFFYKNLTFITPQFYFHFFDRYSAQSLYDSMYLTCFNICFTSLPILIYGLFEQNYSAERLRDSPFLYRIHAKNDLMKWRNFFKWFAAGVWHSLVIFFVPTLSYWHNSTVMPAGRDGYLETYGTVIFHASVVVVNIKLLLHSKYWSVPFLSAIIISLGLLLLMSVVYTAIDVVNWTSSNYWTFIELIQAPSYWLQMTLITFASVLPDLFLEIITNQFTDPLKTKRCGQMRCNLQEDTDL